MDERERALRSTVRRLARAGWELTPADLRRIRRLAGRIRRALAEQRPAASPGASRCRSHHRFE